MNYTNFDQNSQTTLSQAIKVYVKSLTLTQKKSLGTVKKYSQHLLDFCKFTGPDKPIQQITLATIEDYRVIMLDQKLNPKTQSLKLIAIRQLLKWLRLQKIDCLDAEAIELPKVVRMYKEIPNPEDIEKLIASLDLRNKKGLRLKTILSLLQTSGLRISELVSLEVAKPDLENGRTTILGKGSKPRLIQFSPETAILIKKYLAARKKNSNKLFDLTPTHIERLVKQAGEKVGVSLTPHSLRHSYATNLLNHGISIYHVSKFLGHSSIQTSELYLHHTNQELEDIYKSVYPGNVGK
ncbi:tyrosine-type recombinase/integrase [Candidatus Daviesbacteria bacterium]|nr:tyrosine-type recombinase/integrase [Candidatus Daviesbacteria bacterium]